jgi:TetR/AcrR family transcriptional repressor of nem operon
MTTANTTLTTLLNAAIQLMKERGYNGTSVDDICRAAGVTKGSFFHYFSSKEDLARAAIAHSAMQVDAQTEAAGYRNRLDPKERVLGYVEYRKEEFKADIATMSCLSGGLVHEVFVAHPNLRERCAEEMLGRAAQLEADLRAAKALYAPKAEWDVKSLAVHIQAVLQGAFVVAKATGNAAVAADSVEHLYCYVNQLLPRPLV